MNPRALWLAPSPLWEGLLAARDAPAMRRPVLLRFAEDTFMEVLASTLARDPQRLREFIVREETWKEPAAGLGGSTAAEAGEKLKLYQPAHSRFYLLAATLACEVAGLPDHTVRKEKNEAVSFVLRRIEPREETHRPEDRSALGAIRGRAELRNKCDEYAWVTGGSAAGWMAVESDGLAPDEERQPLFPIPFGENGSRRMLYAGLVPVSRQQTYSGAPAMEQPPGSRAVPALDADPRMIEFQSRVLDPWVNLTEWYEKSSFAQGSKEVAESCADSTAQILADFADYLETYLPPVWRAVEFESARGLSGSLLDLYNAFDEKPEGTKFSLRSMLGKAGRQQRKAAPGSSSQDLKDSGAHLLLADKRLGAGKLLARKESNREEKETGKTGPRYIAELVQKALKDVKPVHVEGRLPESRPKILPGETWYVLYCVYERRQCGPGARPVLSEPSRPFQLASFFDADAPARNLQVALPLDVSPEALSKYDKNVAFLLSDELQKQMKRVKGLKELMDGDVNDPSAQIGAICSMSIPIITICALILLMIMVNLLNIIFRWLPFFMVCFPAPNLKAKA
jgi:hypothetical protein